jgi:hypothetical protein
MRLLPWPLREWLRRVRQRRERGTRARQKEPLSPNELRAQESAARLEAMKLEVALELQRKEAGAFDVTRHKAPLVAACERLWYGTTVRIFEGQASLKPYLRAIRAVAAADRLAHSENEWIAGRMVLLGLDTKEINQLRSLDHHLQSLEPILRSIVDSLPPSSAPFIRRAIYYDAIT